MSEPHPAQRPEEPLPKFRVNAQVFQILGLLAVALALPITILVLGLSGMRKDRLKASEEPRISNDAAEVPGLRQSLESIAEANMPIGPVESSMRIFRLRADGAENQEKKRLEVVDFLKRSDAGFAETGDSAMQSWLVAIGANQERSFEEELLRMGFLGEKTGEGSKTIDFDSNSNKKLIYKICLEVSP
jgi:hypothetical protein